MAGFWHDDYDCAAAAAWRLVAEISNHEQATVDESPALGSTSTASGGGLPTICSLWAASMPKTICMVGLSFWARLPSPPPTCFAREGEEVTTSVLFQILRGFVAYLGSYCSAAGLSPLQFGEMFPLVSGEEVRIGCFKSHGMRKGG